MPRVIYTTGYLTEADKTNISPQVVEMVEISSNAFAPGSIVGHTTSLLPAPFNYGGRLREVSSLDFALDGGVGRVTFSISNADLLEVANVAADGYIGWECKVHKVLVLDDGSVKGILLLHGVITGYTMTDQVVNMDVTTRINVENSINNRRVGEKCGWVFKGTECGYSGPLTTCNKLYVSNDGCSGRSNQHRFGGFPDRETIASLGVVSGQGETPGYMLSETFSQQVVANTTTITATDLRFAKCTHTAPITITLPAPSTFPINGQPITIKDCSTAGASTNNITIQAAGGGTVNGGTFVISNTNGAVTLSADRAAGDWRIVADYNSTPASGSGTVTSVAVTAPSSFLSVTGSPVTTSGTIDLALTIQGVNQIFAGPASGVNPLVPDFRSLVLADLPAISTNRLLGRTASGTGVVQEITPGSGVLTWLQTPTAENLLAAVQGTTGTGSLVFSTSPAFNGSITLDDNGELRLREQFGNGSNYVGFRAASSIASNLIWTLPAVDGTSGQFLSTNGSGVLSWATASGGSITDGDKGDITVSSSGAVWTIDNSAVTLAKIQDIATDRILGRVTAGSGPVEEITPGGGILTWLQTPSSANLAASITDETGTGSLVFGTQPTLETPYVDSFRVLTLGVPPNPNTLGGRVLRFAQASGGGNNCVEIVNAANGGTPVIRSFGLTDSNVALRLTAKGTSPVITTASAFCVEGLTSGGITQPGILEARGGNQQFGGGKIYLYERSNNGTNYVGFEAPDLLASDLFWTLPATDGTANQALITDGGAGLSWRSFEVPLTFSTGLTRTTNTITVNTTQNIIRLSNLTTNGFVRATNADGTLSVDTNTYLTGNQTVTLSGDVTGSGATSISTTIANNAVTFAKFVQITTDTLVGRDTDGTGNVESISVAGGIEFSGSGSIRTTAFTGDVTKTAGGTVLTIANDAVTFAKMQNVTSGNLLGRTTASTGDIEQITPGGGVLAWLQDATSAKLATAITDETGTGSLVFGTSPTLTTPRIDVIHAAGTPNNAVLAFIQAASSVNYLQITNAQSSVKPVLEAVGADIAVGIQIKAKGVSSVTCTADSGLVVEPLTIGSGYYGAITVRGGTSAGDGGAVGLYAPGNTTYVGFAAPNTITSSVLYQLPQSDGTSGHVLRTNGSGALSWVAPVTDGDKGDVIVSGSGGTWTIDNNAVTFAKMQNITAARLLGRTGTGSGPIRELSVTSPLTLSVADTLTFLPQNANHVFAGPTPSFRALQTGDIPDLSSIYVTIGSGGTVTSVGLIMPSIFSVSGSPITTSGTFDVGLVNQQPNRIFAGPSVAPNAPPTFRAMVTADIPNTTVTYEKIQNVTGDRVLGRRGALGTVEELTLSQALDFVGSAAQGDILYRGASSWTQLAAGTRGRYLQTGGASANPSWATAMAFKNVLINGDMQVAQRGTNVPGIAVSGYNTADRWRVEISSLGTWTQTVETADAPANTEFRRSLKMNCSAAKITPAAGDYVLIQQRIEGLNLQHFMKGTTNARQFSLGFWVKTSTPGTYIAELFDHTSGANRHVAATYSVSAANTWEFKTITFPADTSGVLANTSALALSVNFWMGAGTTYTNGTLATTWASVTNGNRAAGISVNLAGATNRYMQITGVQLEPGPVATEFEYLPFDVQLQRCYRYFVRIKAEDQFSTFALGVIDQATRCNSAFTKLPVTMRVRPDLDFASLRIYDGSVAPAVTVFAANFSDTMFMSFAADCAAGSGLTIGRAGVIQANGTTAGRIDCASEL